MNTNLTLNQLITKLNDLKQQLGGDQEVYYPDDEYSQPIAIKTIEIINVEDDTSLATHPDYQPRDGWVGPTHYEGKLSGRYPKLPNSKRQAIILK